MTIEIINEIEANDFSGNSISRTVEIAIDNGGPIYRHFVGGLPLVGDLQAILDANEAKLFLAAETKGELFDVFKVEAKHILKAVVLVILDEINALRQVASLPLRDESQIRGAIKNKLQSF